jgi:4-azaleucine resistance transporter AzlC
MGADFKTAMLRSGRVMQRLDRQVSFRNYVKNNFSAARTDGMTRAHAIGDGMLAAIPIVMAYVPVGLTFGIAGTAAGLAPLQVLMISAFIYAGASQFLLLASIQSGLPVAWVIMLCAMLNARHFLYGPLLSGMLPPRLRTRLMLATGLTDEVFSTAFRRLPEIDIKRGRGAWMAGLGAAAWVSWLAGTALGAYAGDHITRDFPALAQVLSFTLPALFLTLTIQSTNATNRAAALAAAVVAGALALAGHTSLAILGGAAGGCAYYWLRRKEPA